MKKFRIRFITAGILALISGSATLAGPGESAVITLVFPPGARATGLGETFTAIADDANATFFNPAGLGQPPLANSWHVYLQNKGYTFTAIAANRKKAFETQEKIWVGTNKGLLRFNGKAWESSESYLIEQNDDIMAIVRKYLDFDDQALLKKAALQILHENNIGQKHEQAVAHLIGLHLRDTLNRSSDSTELASEISLLDKADQTAAKIYALISPKVDSVQADTLSNSIEKVLATPDKELKDLVELKVPFSIAVADSVTALLVDETEQLWVGTTRGLWHYDGSRWKITTVLDGLPSNNVTAITLSKDGEIGVGTDRGVSVYSGGQWRGIVGTGSLPDTNVTGLCFGATAKEVYVGTRNGLARLKDSTWTVFDTTNGLLSRSVSALFYDSQHKLWIGSENGVTNFDDLSWKRYRFPGSRVTMFAEYQPGRVWIGTNKGAISYQVGSTTTDKDGKLVQNAPEWKAFHSKNALAGDVVSAIAIHGKDVWLVTDKAVNHYDCAENQVLFFYEPLLPAFGLKDLWHTYFSFVMPTEDWGTFGLSVNYINMGVNQWTDELGRVLGAARSWEGVFGLSYGLGLTEGLSLGFNVKYVQSALAPGIGPSGEGTGRTFAIDAAVLKRNIFVPKLDLGFMFQNMGPAIFYISEDQKDPIPFTLRLGLDYRAIESAVNTLTFAADFDRELVKNNASGNPDPFYQALVTAMSDTSFVANMEEVIAHAGVEWWYVNFLALRTGFLFDWVGERYELTFGLGLKYGNMNFDWSYIHSPEGFLKSTLQDINSSKEGSTGARHGQWRISLISRF